MKHSQITLIRSEIATFADDIDDIIYESDGSITFERMGKVLQLRLVKKGEEIAIQYEGKEFGYRDFLAKELAHLEHFAKKMLT